MQTLWIVIGAGLFSVLIVYAVLFNHCAHRKVEPKPESCWNRIPEMDEWDQFFAKLEDE